MEVPPSTEMHSAYVIQALVYQHMNNTGKKQTTYKEN